MSTVPGLKGRPQPHCEGDIKIGDCYWKYCWKSVLWAEMAMANFQRWEHIGMMKGNQESHYSCSRVTSGKVVEGEVREIMRGCGGGTDYVGVA